MNTSFDVSATKIRPYLLIDIGTKEKNRGMKFFGKKVILFIPLSRRLLASDRNHSGKVGGMDKGIERTKCGVDRLVSVSSA
jgi:hypothetical protein